MEKYQIQALMNEHELTVSSVFVPWSKSRNFNSKDAKYVHKKSLNWKVTLLYRGKPVIETDYMAGIAHSPAFKAARKIGAGVSLADEPAIESEVEGGFAIRHVGMSMPYADKKKPLLPDNCDVLYSLLSDGDAIDHASFEDWADNYGYDTDSRKAETIYRACLDTGLKLRASLGDELIAKLREVFQDY
jgi:hypothetical protein